MCSYCRLGKILISGFFPLIDILDPTVATNKNEATEPEPTSTNEEKTSMSHDSDSADEIGDDDEPVRKKARSHSRVKWTEAEVKELQKFFKNHLKAKTTPGQSECNKVLKQSKAVGGQLARRTPALIIKKISNMNKK